MLASWPPMKPMRCEHGEVNGHGPDVCEVAAPAGFGYSSVKQNSRRQLLEFFSFDHEYVRRLSEGDLETERHFASYFSPLLSIKLRQRLRSDQEVNDLRQEVFLRVLQCLRKGAGVQQPERLGAFVNAVCNNVVLEHFRSFGRLQSWDESTDVRRSDADPENQILVDESHAHVRTLLRELPARDREVLNAIFLEERNKDVVCKEFGVGREYLRVILHRARTRLRQLIVAAAGPSEDATKAKRVSQR